MEEQKLHRRVWQHDAKPGKAWGDTGQRLVTTAAFAEQDRRACRQGHQTRFADADLDERSGRSGIRQHHHKGLLVTLLALTQQSDGDRVARVAGQMETAQALDGENLSLQQQGQGRADRVIGQAVSLAVEQENLWSALRTAIGLGMKTPVLGPPVLTLTTVTHRKRFEAGAYAVVGQAAADGVAWSAIGAIGEGITPARAAGVEHLGQALATDRRVVSDHRRGPATAAVDDHEIFADACRCRIAGGHRVDPGQRRRVLLQSIDETLHLCGRAANLDLDTA
ncbi:MAG: hypothetical protein AW09_004587 [Candidatus Accumulibacter phosphatis]|uniref:Uncharacterized protein n=1 Tax=Candidatus Accumulibacter phosphatis TaxID=327160 RepID=A0A084Y6I2_9PROT|nr:MAG: hypothetical protein AW09_004587 [Candidatus Accumulibacter phosphatis]